MPSEPTSSLPTKKRTRSSIALQVDSTGPVGIQVKMTRGERGRRTLYFELQYEELVESRDKLVQDVVERLAAERNPPHKDVSPYQGRKAGASLRRVTTEHD